MRPPVVVDTTEIPTTEEGNGEMVNEEKENGEED